MTKEKLCRLEQSELVKLIDEGQLVYLPCKVGDTVYIDGGNSSLTVKEWHMQDNKIMWFGARFNPNGLDVRFNIDRIGKTVFLTREQAEKALKESETK